LLAPVGRGARESADRGIDSDHVPARAKKSLDQKSSPAANVEHARPVGRPELAIQHLESVSGTDRVHGMEPGDVSVRLPPVVQVFVEGVISGHLPY
jgi:hypothetical protein